MNTVLIVAAVVIVVLLAIFAYAITRRPVQRTHKEARPPRRATFSMSPLPPLSARPVRGAGPYDDGDAPSALLAATVPTEPANHHHHAASTSHATHATPSHDHGSSYGGDSYGGHHDGGSSYGGHDSGGGFDGGGGGGHGH